MIGECASSCDYLHKVAGLFTDAPHVTFELGLEVITAIPVYFFGKWAANRRIAREHALLDAEHGFQHSQKGLDSLDGWV